jgi:hypothetical protein
MFGNARGWIISLFIAIAMGMALARSAQPYRISAPTHAAEVSLAMKPIALPIAPGTIVPANDPCDAGDIYRAAMQAYERDPASYESFRTHPSLDRITDVPAVEQIVKATHCSLMTLFRNQPAALIDYRPEHPPLVAIRKLGDATLAIGLLYRMEKKDADARKHLEAGFALGAKLFQERVTFEEMGVGIGLMRSAADAMASLATEQGDATRAAACAGFSKQANAYSEQLIETYKIIGSIDEDYAGPYAGDLFEIAQSYQAEPMWRVEAIKHLGHFRFNSNNRGDQIGAQVVLKKLSATTNIDPTLRVAAEAAKDLSAEQHRTTR